MMAKTVYMVADGDARAIFENEFDQWSKVRPGSVRVDSVRLDALKCISEYSGTIYRCEPIEPGNDVPEERPTVKAYVRHNPDGRVAQDIWACASESLARDIWPASRIFEIEMREVPPPKKRETGWAVYGTTLNGLYGPSGFGSARPFVFSTQSAADELAEMLGHGAAAVEVYRDTMEPVDAE